MLRRVQIPFLKLDMLQTGNIVNIFSKLLLITSCLAAPASMRESFKNSESTFAMIKPSTEKIHGKILTFILKKGFRIVRIKNAIVDKEFAVKLYERLAGNNLLPAVVNYIISGEVIGMELVAPNAVKAFRACLGATDPAMAAPGTLRREYGESIFRNIAHGVQTHAEVIEALDLFFGVINGKPRLPYRATRENCTCCVVIPHAIVDGNMVSIIEHITTSDKFYITAMAMFSMNIPNAKEFYEVYDQVLITYEEMSVQLAEGKCLALEVKCKDPTENVVSEFRKLCGPRDPDLCRQLYPDSIRALYGKTIVQNAVHCTDLPEDGVREVEYFFKILPNDMSS